MALLQSCEFGLKIEKFSDSDSLAFSAHRCATKRALSPALDSSQTYSLSRHTICSHIGAVPAYVELWIIFDAGGASTSTGKSANITVYAHIKLMISLALGSLPLDSFIVVQARLIASYTMWDTRNVVTLIIWHAHPAVDLGVSGAWG